MKKRASMVTLVTTLVMGLLIVTGLAAEASAPRWPEPAWFAQFSQTTQPIQPAQPQPESQPTPAPQPEPQQPTPEPQPQQPAPAPQQPAPAVNGWLSPAWFNLYNQANTTQPVQQEPSIAPNPIGGPNQAQQLTAQELQLANLANQERSQRGLKTLQVDPELSKWARIKSQDMVANNYFAHESPTYGKASQMLRNGGVTGSYFGENLAMTSSVTRAHQLFMGSSIHRAQILNQGYTHIGISIAYKGSTLYVTQLFAAR